VSTNKNHLSFKKESEIMKFQLCSPKEATHVRIIDEDSYELTYGAVYEYHFDDDPSEKTHYVITDEGSYFYDFECVIKVEYLKVI
jgi:hypothetical protein